jgi:hypothetical protein
MAGIVDLDLASANHSGRGALPPREFLEFFRRIG